MKPICVTAQTLAMPQWRRVIGDRYVPNEAGCWEWTAAVDRYGYGQVQVKIGGRLRQTGAHRASWILHRGPISGDLQIDHLCLNRKCINPVHLELVTPDENKRRTLERGSFDRGTMGGPRIPLEERKGCGEHGKSAGRWCLGKDGYWNWQCRVCGRAYQKAWRERRAASRSVAKSLS